MNHPLPLLLAESPFAVHEALELGLSRRRVDADELLRPHQGVRSTAAASNLVDRCWELLPVLRPDAVFSHLTAAGLLQLPLPCGASELIHVTSPSGAHPARPGVIAHRTKVPSRGGFVEGLPVVDPVTAWMQCAALLRRDEVIAMGDALAGTWSPHEAAREREIGELTSAVDRWGSRRGASFLRSALPEIRAGVGSPKETELRLLLVRAGVREPECNGLVLTTTNGVELHGDLVWRDERLVVEYEGDGHRVRRRQWMHDLERYELFQDDGWRVVRVTELGLDNRCSTVARVARLLAERAVP